MAAAIGPCGSTAQLLAVTLYMKGAQAVTAAITKLSTHHGKEVHHAPKLLDRAPKQAPASPMNWRPRSADDLIGQARRVAASQIGKAKRIGR